MNFTWDSRKSRTNLRKHRVAFDEAATIFGDPLAATIADPDHSQTEDRFVSVGVSSTHRLLVVCYTEETATIRIISAREASAHEKKRYEA